MSSVPPDHWDDGDGGLASRLTNLNVNAPVFIPNVNAAPFVPSGAFQSPQVDNGEDVRQSRLLTLGTQKRNRSPSRLVSVPHTTNHVADHANAADEEDEPPGPVHVPAPAQVSQDRIRTMERVH